MQPYTTADCCTIEHRGPEVGVILDRYYHNIKYRKFYNIIEILSNPSH